MITTTNITLDIYADSIRDTDRLADLQSLIFGLYGEVGSVVTTAKKQKREGMVFNYRMAITEEFGDVFWYFTRLTEKLQYDINSLISAPFCKQQLSKIIITDMTENPIAHIPITQEQDFTLALKNLATSAASLLSCLDSNEDTNQKLKNFFVNYLYSLKAADISFTDVIHHNIEKSRGRFLDPDIKTLKRFDDDFEEEERLPEIFEIVISERPNGKSYLRWKGVFIGDPLTDNIRDSDGYRFHDVFHMANAAILHWSPTFRALIKHKRKSNPKTDEEQDSGRAIVIEEGLSAWIFSVAKTCNFFEDQNKLSFDMLKTVKQFVSGYEIEDCPLSLWERAILDGYRVFRKLKEHKCGIIVGNRTDRTIEFQPLEK
ncbi:pyrophosphatase [Pseudomonas iridis]|uniref:pyrophosphatase n=1 Tax=Pseudomonas iridis TaxID=2710587 RepID=UPI0021C057D2|nr:pyrophosphatase [Pseudomonas iridis]MCT8947816.1 pyrophosphatase [Pseudomonas iridis]